MPLGEDMRPCTVCGEPVLWGTRHPVCGRSVTAIEDANARVRWALSAIVKALDALGEHNNLVRLGVQALADQCGSCKGTGSGGYHGCTDCLGTGVDQHSANEVLRTDAGKIPAKSPQNPATTEGG